MSPLVEIRGLCKSFPWRRAAWGEPSAGGDLAGGSRLARRLVALDDVDLEVERGECLAVVGESGSGKTTLARCLVRLLEPDRGEIRFDGQDLLRLPAGELRRLRRRFQISVSERRRSLRSADAGRSVARRASADPPHRAGGADP